MSLNNIRLPVGLLLLLVLQQATSQQPTESDSILITDLDEVVVTATRTLRQVSSLPLPVTLVSKEQIRRSGLTRLGEVLNEQTGIIMTPDATVGGTEGVQIQGIASDYVMVLIDGVPVVGRSSGNLDLSRFAIGNIAQVEIVKGPSSSLFGSEALGGVINIITEEPSDARVRGQVAHRAASFNNHNTLLTLMQKKGKLGYSLFADRLSTDGYDLAPDSEGRTVNPYDNYTVSARLSLEASERLGLLASARYFAQEFEVAPGNSEESDLNLLLRGDHTAAKEWELQYEFYYTNYRTDERSVDPIDETVLLENDFDQRLLRPEIRSHYAFRKTDVLTLGAGTAYETLDRSLFSEQVRFTSQYLYGQYDFMPLEALNIIAGARFDNHSVYDSQLSPKLSVKYDLSEYFSVKASVGSGFKAPDFRQLYLDFTNASGGGYSVFGKEVELAGIGRLQENDEIASLAVPETDLGQRLEAERSVGYNLGLQYRRGILKAGINLFRNDFRNLIDTRVLAAKTNGQNVFGYINRERVYTQGAEVDLSLVPIKHLRFSAGYQLLFAYDKDKEDAIDAGMVFARDPQTQETIRLERSEYFGLENRSRHTLNAKVFYEIPKWEADANLRVVYRSKFGLTDRNGNDLLDNYDNAFVDGYALVNLAFGKTLFRHYRLQAGALNLLDFRGSNPLAGTGSSVQVNPGIQFFTKLSIQF